MTIQTPILDRPAEAAASPLVARWTEVLAPEFVRFRHLLVEAHSRHSDSVFPTLGIERGLRILDVGCGFGDTAIRLADATGTRGEVLGVDCCQAFLDYAWHGAELQWTPNVSFACRDIERGLEVQPFDMVFSRFGTMFFADPVAGLRVLRASLNPGGRIAHIVWRDRADNPWLTAALDVLRRHLPTEGDGQADAPGHFSMADAVTTGAQMAAAGFTDIEFRRIDAKVLVGRDIAEAIDFQLSIGPAAETLRAAGPLGQQKRPEIEAALARMFEAVIAREGDLWMDSSSWLITARSPG